MRVHAAVGAAALLCGLASCDWSGNESSGGEVTRFAQDNAQRIRDVDVGIYTLDIERMRQVMVGMRALALEAQSDSSLAAAIAPSAQETVLASIIRLEGSARARRILGSVGLTPREYVMTRNAYLQALAADAALVAQPTAKTPPGINMQNVEFIRQHREELDRLSP